MQVVVWYSHKGRSASGDAGVPPSPEPLPVLGEPPSDTVTEPVPPSVPPAAPLPDPPSSLPPVVPPSGSCWTVAFCWLPPQLLANTARKTKAVGTPPVN